MKHYRILFYTFVIALILSSCTKGEKGPKGDPGAAGKGPVIESELTTIAGAMWKHTEDSLEWEVTVPAKNITQVVIDKGSVQMYIQKEGTWYSLPYFEEDDYTTFAYAMGEVHLLMGNSHHVLPERPKAQQYKIVTLATQ